MDGFLVFRAAVFVAFGYMAVWLMVWRRVEELRARNPSKALLPSAIAFFSGAGLLWVWSGSHREVGDAGLSRLVLSAKFLFLAAMTLLALSFFLD